MNNRDRLAELLEWSIGDGVDVDGVEHKGVWIYKLGTSESIIQVSGSHPIPDRGYDYLDKVWKILTTLRFKWRRDEYDMWITGRFCSATTRITGDFYADWLSLLVKTLEWLEANDKPALDAVRKAVNG